MADIAIEKRTRSTDKDFWGVWGNTSEAPPYVNTDLVEYRVQTGTSIVASKITNGKVVVDNEGEFLWEGSGIFDNLMAAVNGNIKVEFDNGRIVGKEYASVYLAAIQSVIQQSVLAGLSEDEKIASVALVKSKTEMTEKQQELIGRQMKLVDTQRHGFRWDADSKLLKHTLDSWSVAFSVSQDATSVPSAIDVDSINTLMTTTQQNLANPAGIA